MPTHDARPAGPKAATARTAGTASAMRRPSGSPRPTTFAALLLLLASCATTPSSSRDAINAVHLFGMPVAIRLHQRPGPNAIAIRVFATSVHQAHGQPIRSGTLEILAFDGPVPAGRALPASPTATWTFTPDQLKPFAGNSSLGTGYQLNLPWSGPPPSHAHVTVIARYSAPHLTKSVLSGSATIAIPPPASLR